MLSYIVMSKGNLDIAKQLREARHRLGISQRELGNRSGLTQAQISRIENGFVDMRISSLLALTKVLELEVSFNHLSPSRSLAEKPRTRKGLRRVPWTKNAPRLTGPGNRPGIFGDIDEELL